jgi:hypothetical protein
VPITALGDQPSFEVSNAMRCLSCGAEMRLEQVAVDDTMPISGFEHHTFVCSVCGDIERRLVFTRRVEPADIDPVSMHSAAPVSPPSTLENDRATAFGVVKRVIMKLCGVRHAVKRQLVFGLGKASRSTVSEPITPHTSAPPVEAVWAPQIESASDLKTPPTSVCLAELASISTGLPKSVSPQTDSDRDECEALLRRATQMVRGPTRSFQITTSLSEARSAAPAESLSNSSQAEGSRRSHVAVQIHYDPKKAKYVAKDTKSGLGVLRHEESARLRAMCDRMGWRVVDGTVTSAQEAIE